MKQILWLPAWYPNQLEPYTGDFIQRHARATSLYHPVHVIHVVRDSRGKITEHIKEEPSQSGNLHEKIIYYYSPAYTIPVLTKIISNKRYRKIYRKAIKEHINTYGTPSCTHLHIAGKNGLQALWLKKKYKIPFLVTEHWTDYLPEAKPSFKEWTPVFKMLWYKVMNAASGLTVVSNYLGEAIRRLKKDTLFTVIPNVVNQELFFPAEKKQREITQFIHISTLGYQKNPEAIWHALALVKKDGFDFRLSVFGPERKDLQHLSASIGIGEQVQFHKEIPQQSLAAFIQHSDALILYSRYETFGCVLIEANACGIPCIVSDIPVFHEIIEEGFNGYMVPAENVEALAEKIKWFIRNQPASHQKEIAAATTEKYSYKKVGKLFSDFYQETFPARF